MTVSAAFDRLVHALPHGGSLPAGLWRARHRAIVRVTVVATLLVFGFGRLEGWTWSHAVLEVAVPLLIVVLARYGPGSQRVRASLVAVALMSVAAIAVHASGTIEAHFLFFIAVPIVALYEDWGPFIASAVLVLIHHVAVGLHDPSELYNHGAALQAPLRWGLIHAALFLVMCVVSLVHWRIHERHRAWLAQRALHDGLTGLANRTLLYDRLEHALEDRTRTGAPVSVLSLDLDEFKAVNDTFGHPAGDAVLVEVAVRLRAAVRPGDTPARPGGDEFVVVLPGATPDGALETARRITGAIAVPITAGGGQLTVGSSVGVATATTAADTAETLLGRADDALLAAKRGGPGACLLAPAHLDRI